MKLYGWLGFLLLLISEYCLFRKIEPFYSWFYCFAWWSYILLADNLLLRLRGRSLLCGRRAELWRMLPLSVFIWLIFEGYNLALRNWAYDGVPAQMWIRWVGYSVAFATVLPGVFIAADIFEFILFGPQAQLASQAEKLPAPPATATLPILVPLGLCLSAAPLLWPRYFFPTIWVGPIFLFDPFLERLGLQSLSLRIAAGDRRKVFSLLAGGLFCGVLWEFWNFWAASRWIYSVPFFGNWKIFEMPILGFFGFPPFALECWILYHLLTQMQRRWRSRPARAAFWLGIGLFCILMFHAIDTHTVLHFVSNGHSGTKTQSAGNAVRATDHAPPRLKALSTHAGSITA
ncbi:MAG: hypothetical protein ABSH28_10975 [Acidobacteriota bacterium]|jgi:hypothetical protein